MKGNSNYHWWENLSRGMYRIGWTAPGSRRARNSYSIEQHRDTDYAGVVRFCKRWGIKPPPAEDEQIAARL